MSVPEKIKYVATLCNPEFGLTKGEVLARLKVKETTFRTYFGQAKAAGYSVTMPPVEKDSAKRTLAFLRCITLDLKVGRVFSELRDEQSPEVLAFAERLTAEMARMKAEHRAAMTVLRAEHRAEMEARQPKWNEALFLRIEDLPIPIRRVNLLISSGITHVWQLAEKTKNDLGRIKGFGPDSRKEIEGLLAELGLSLNMNLEGFPKHTNT